MIAVHHLWKIYGDFVAVKDLSFTVNKGEIVGFLGPNGAGKTTTMRVLTCFMPPSKGEVTIAGHDVRDDSMAARRLIGYLPEQPPLYLDMTVEEYLRFVARIKLIPGGKVKAAVERVVELCGLAEMRKRLIRKLSKGYRQRVGLAAALVHDPDILILNEPTVGLDPNQIVEIRNLIKKLGKEKTVILCSHILAEVELTCNRILIINEGQIVASGTPAELKSEVEGHASLRVVVRGEKKAIVEVMKAIPGVKGVRAHAAKEKGALILEIETAKKKDLREAVTQAIFENHFTLLEIHKEFVSLEEIFNQVTQNNKD